MPSSIPGMTRVYSEATRKLRLTIRLQQKKAVERKTSDKEEVCVRVGPIVAKATKTMITAAITKRPVRACRQVTKSLADVEHSADEDDEKDNILPIRITPIIQTILPTPIQTIILPTSREAARLLISMRNRALFDEEVRLLLSLGA